MAVYFDSGTDVAVAAAGGSVGWSTTNFTACGFARIETYVGGGAEQFILIGSIDGVTSSVGMEWAGNTDSNMYLFSNGSGGSSQAFGSRPAVGSPFFWYLRCSGTGAGQFTGGWCLLDGTAFVTAAMQLQSGANGTTASIAIGGNLAEHLAGQMAAFRIYDRVLTDAELEVERYSLYPAFFDVRGFWPFWDVATYRTDFSGNGATLEDPATYSGSNPSDTAVSFPVRVRRRRANSGLGIAVPAAPPPWYTEARVVRRRGV